MLKRVPVVPGIELAVFDVLHGSTIPTENCLHSSDSILSLALPDGWTATKKWPVVVVIESADREFENATALPLLKRERLDRSYLSLLWW